MSSAVASSARREAERLVASEYEPLKAEVTRTVASKLAASGVPPAELDLDASYNEAWHQVYERLVNGVDVENRTALLITIAHRRALNEHRALRRRRTTHDELDVVGADPELEARLDAESDLRRVIVGMRERFGRRERQAAALCYLYEYSRAEAADAIGVSAKRMEKIMDRVSKEMRALVADVQRGGDCARYESLIRAYAIGLLEEDGERHRLARDHLDDCSSCRRQVLLLRGIVAITPPAPLLAGAIASAAGGGSISAIGKGVYAAANAGRRAGELLHLGGNGVAVKSTVAAAAAAVGVGTVTIATRERERPPAVVQTKTSPASAAPTTARRSAPAPAAKQQQRKPASPSTTTTTPPVTTPTTTQQLTVSTQATRQPATERPVHDGAEEFELR